MGGQEPSEGDTSEETAVKPIDENSQPPGGEVSPALRWGQLGVPED